MPHRWFCEVSKMWDSHSTGTHVSKWFATRDDCLSDLKAFQRQTAASDDVFVGESWVERRKGVA